MLFAQASRTAEAAATLRFLAAQRPEGRAVFDDTLAQHFMRGPGREALRFPRLINRVMGFRAWDMRPIAAQVLARSRVAEDVLHAAVARGVRQYVIVGAGFDSFFWRRPDWAADLQVFELDHPATQAEKRRRSAAAGLLGAPYQIAVDFAQETAADALRRSAFDPQQPAVFAWLGVTHYLKPVATHATLEALASCAAPGSELVFDYSLPLRQIPRADWRLSAQLGLVTALLGEPLWGGLAPDTLAEWASAAGWTVTRDLSGPPAGRLPVPQVTRLAHWRR